MRLAVHRRQLVRSAVTLALLVLPAHLRADLITNFVYPTQLGVSNTGRMIFQCGFNLLAACSLSPDFSNAFPGNSLTLFNGGGSITFQFLAQPTTFITVTNAEVQQINLGSLVSTVAGPFTGFPDNGTNPLFFVELQVIDVATERGTSFFHGGVYLTRDGSGEGFLSFNQPISVAPYFDGIERVLTFMKYPPNDRITPTNNRVDLFAYEVINFLPEPSTISLTLAGLGLVAAVGVRRRKQAPMR